MAFESPDYPLSDLLEQAETGVIQLPDFQREWKWDDDHIRSLLASISLGYPVGVMMMLETGSKEAAFAARPLAGSSASAAPERLLLDGQQRMTSLSQALSSRNPVDTTDARGKRLKRWYYIDMSAVLDGDDREEAILSIPEDRIVKDNFGRDVLFDYSTFDAEVEHEVFPMWRVFDSDATNEWMVQHLKLSGKEMPEQLDRWNAFQKKVLVNFTSYLIPVIVLNKATSKAAVCTVFEKVNTGGVPLNVFELMTATFAIDGFRLNDDWKERADRLSTKRVLEGVESTDFLQIVTLLATWNRKASFGGDPEHAPAVSCKRKDILKLTLDDYLAWADKAVEGLEWAASFLSREHIFRSRDLPYKTQLVPLAALRVILGPGIDDHGTDSQIRRWYWCGVLGEQYGAATETRFARDVEQVPVWLKHGPQPKTVDDAVFHSGRLLTLRTRNSAAYKGMYALLMAEGGLDWQKHQQLDMAAFFDYRIDIHHIFPKAWCKKHNIDTARRESIVNKTAISAATNRSIGGRAPSEYMGTLEESAGVDGSRLDEIVETHAIDPEYLRADDFDKFFEDRADRLLDLISDAMGKPAIRESDTDEGDPSAFEPEADDPEDLEDDLNGSGPAFEDLVVHPDVP